MVMPAVLMALQAKTLNKKKIEEDTKMNEPTLDAFEGCIRNADNSGLGPMKVIGYFPEVSGSGAKEIPEFNATKYELITLAKHWAEVAISLEYYWFISKKDDKNDDRKRKFAWRRVNRIRNLLDEEVDVAVEEVYRDNGAKHDKMRWDEFISRRGKAQPEEREPRSM